MLTGSIRLRRKRRSTSHMSRFSELKHPRFSDLTCNLQWTGHLTESLLSGCKPGLTTVDWFDADSAAQ